MKKNDVENALLEMDMPVGILGFGYIVNTVMKLDTPEWEHSKITAMYSYIAKERNTTGSRVEKAIRHAFEIVRAKGKPEFVEKYIGFDNATNSNSLRRLFMVLKQNESNEFSEKKPTAPSCGLSAKDELIRNINAALNEYFASIVN